MRIAEREARAVWPGSFLKEDEMIDLSKIDWAKCELKPLPCLMTNGETRQLRVFTEWDAPHRNLVMKVGDPGSVVMAKTGHGSLGWQFLSVAIVSITDDMLAFVERAKEVNDFIDAETARIEAEESFIKVHWRDAEWLASLNASVQVLDNEIVEWVKFQVNARAQHDRVYRADRRTFTPGYDPEKPRWVEVNELDFERLTRRGISGTRRPLKCMIDIHELPPGVPLHEEPKPVPKFLTVSSCDVKHLVGLGCSVYVEAAPGGQRSRVYDLVRSATAKYFVDENTLPRGIGISPENPKPVPRPCTKEFALKHPKESEYRVKCYPSTLWSKWGEVTKYSPDVWRMSHDYEFRTTAPAETKSRVVAEIQVESLVAESRTGGNDGKYVFNAIAKPSPSGIKNWLVFEVATDCREFKNPRIALIIDEVE